MLTDEQRQQIRAEEIFRRELRRSIDEQKPPLSRREKVWALLNSSFVLWLLSSVLVSWLTTQYAEYQSAEAERLRRQDLVRRLDTEIGTRIFYAGLHLELVRKNTVDSGAGPDGKAVLKRTERSLYKDLELFLDNSEVSRNVSVFADYRSKNFVPLVIELSELVPADEVTELQSAPSPSAATSDSSAVPTELQSALAAFLKVTELGANLSLDRAVGLEEQVKAINATLSLLHTEIQRPRWRLAIFPAPPD